MKKIGFLSFGHWSAAPHSQVRSASDALIQSIELAEAVEDLGADGAYFRVHHFAQQLASPFPLLAAIGARTKRIEIGTAVIDMRYENPLYMVEDAGAADLIAGGRLQLGISRGSPEQVIDGFRYFGYVPPDGETDADMARQHTEVFLEALSGVGFAEPNPSPMFPNPPGLLRPEPHSPGLRDRIWWGAGSRATAEWTAQQGMNLMSSTLHDRGRRRAVPRAPGRADPAVPRGVGGGRARARAARVGQSEHLRARRRSRSGLLRARQPGVGQGRLHRRADQGDLRPFVCRGARRPRGARRRNPDQPSILVDSPTDVVGAELLVIKDRHTVLHDAFGWRDREAGIPMETDTLFNIRSMTKPITGAAIQLLVDDGILALDDRVSTYLPGFDTDPSGQITIEQLLTHTSGLPLSIVTEAREYDSLREMADAIGEGGPQFEPGSKFWYSDAGADVLGAIVEQASGSSLEGIRDRAGAPAPGHGGYLLRGRP